MTIDKEKLRALAEAATQNHGARRVEFDHNGRHVIGDGSWKILSAWHTPDGKVAQNAEFAAAASPATVLALLSEIERLKAQVRLAGVAGEMAVHEAVGRAATDYGVAILERDQLKVENEVLRKDAERYRWLRDGAGYCDTRDIPGMAPARMDAFIDTAMAKEVSHG